VRLLDRREHDTKALVAIIGEWISTARIRRFDLLVAAASLR
jgi:hypothetical protein